MSLERKPILMVTAEASSYPYAQDLISKFHKLYPNQNFVGIFPKEFKSERLDIWSDARELSVMGGVEVLKKIFTIRKAFKKILNKIDQGDYKKAILLDYSGFNLRLARELKKRNIKVIYYISPKIWAWNEKRIKKIKQYVDHMCVVHPFEVSFYQDRGYTPVTYVGHPLYKSYQAYLGQFKDAMAVKKSYGILEQEKVLGLMPGSRKSEIEKLLPELLKTAQSLIREKPSLKPIVLCSSLESVKLCQKIMREEDIEFQWVCAHPWEMISLCDMLIVASGTATLQVGLMKKPMLIVYKMNAISAFLAQRFVKIKNFGLVNIILQKTVAPEFFQSRVEVSKLVQEAQRQFFNEEIRRAQIVEYEKLPQLFDDKCPSAEVIKLVESY